MVAAMSRVKGLQCKDIPDLPILQFLAGLNGKWANWYATVDGVPFERSVVTAMPPNLPRKLHHAKMVQMVHRGVVDGCTCGCRGDWVITEKGLAEIERTTKYETTAIVSGVLH